MNAVIDHVVSFVGGFAICLVLLALAAWATVALIHAMLNNVRKIRLIFRIYWKFYDGIRQLPPGEYRKYRVTWDKSKGEFTDFEGIK